MKPLFFALFSALLLSSCKNFKQTEASIQTPLAEQLVGEWRNIYGKVTLRSADNTDSSRVMEVREDNWEALMNMKPIRTFFKADGTYNSEHRNLSDSIVYNPAGKWKIAGDSLLMVDTMPQAGVSYKYKVIITDSIAEFFGVEDFDRDGVKDDEYYGRQRRL